MNAQQPLKVFGAAQYRIQFQGRATADWSSWLQDADVTFTGSGPTSHTILVGKVQDQPALFGLLSLIRDLGLPLIAVELIQPLEPSSN